MFSTSDTMYPVTSGLSGQGPYPLSMTFPSSATAHPCLVPRLSQTRPPTTSLPAGDESFMQPYLPDGDLYVAHVTWSGAA